MRKHSLLSLMLVVAVMALGVVFSPTQAEEDPLQEEVLSTPGETLEQSLAKAQAAATRSQMNVTVSAVGFDIPAGSEAEKYLQSTAQAGRGSYFPAKDARQLAAALGAAASGQTAATPSALVVGRKVVNDKLQGEADHFPQTNELACFWEFKGMPQKTQVDGVWKRDGKEYGRRQQEVGPGNGWSWFAIRTTAAAGFPVGKWSVEIQSGSGVLARKNFTIGVPAG